MSRLNEDVFTLVCVFSRYDFALSREQKNKKGGKMYIQDKMEVRHL